MVFYFDGLAKQEKKNKKKMFLFIASSTSRFRAVVPPEAIKLIKNLSKRCQKIIVEWLRFVALDCKRFSCRVERKLELGFPYLQVLVFIRF